MTTFSQDCSDVSRYTSNLLRYGLPGHHLVCVTIAALKSHFADVSSHKSEFALAVALGAATGVLTYKALASRYLQKEDPHVAQP